MNDGHRNNGFDLVGKGYSGSGRIDFGGEKKGK